MANSDLWNLYEFGQQIDGGVHQLNIGLSVIGATTKDVDFGVLWI